MKARDLQIELLRITCCFAVIMIHVSPEYSPNGAYNHTALILQSIVRAGLPIFFIISGYFLLNQPITSLRKFYVTRLPGVVIPFLVYGYIHFFMVHNMWNLPGSWRAFFHARTLGNFLGLVVTGPAVNYKGFVSQHFWFVYWILGLYLITPVLKVLTDAIKPQHAWAAILVLVGLHAYNLYVPNPTIFLPSVNIWLLYYLIGGLIQRVDGERFKMGAWVLIPAMCLATAEITRLNAAHGWPMNQYVEGVNMIVLAGSIFYVFKGMAIERGRAVFTFLSERTYGIYLAHIFIYYYFNDKVKAVFADSFVWALGTGVLVFVLALALSTAVDLLIVKPILNAIRNLNPGSSRLSRHQG